MTAQTADFLSSVPMFSGLQRDELLKFAELTRERTYPKGSVILFQGDPGDSLYVLRQGRVKVLLILRREDFRRRVEANPTVAWALLSELSRRLRRADQKIGGLVLLDVPGRISRLLLDLSAESGGANIEKPLTHQTIAQMIGASRETVSRAMKEFQEEGLIRVERRRIAVANREALEKRAQVRM